MKATTKMSRNIGRDQTDRSYRYKMPDMITKIEGRGNGIKTVIVNMDDVARALHCPNIYPTKFFGIELGAQSKYDKKTDRAIVNGKHDKSTLTELLNKFIEQFVLCPTCKLPEINMDVKKSGIKIDCRACGHNSQLKSVHKLVGYILNNPPESKKKAKDGNGNGGESPDEEDEEDEGKEEAQPKPRSRKGADDDEDIPESEIQWWSDTSKEAADARKEAEFEEMRGKKSVDAILTASASAGAENPVETLKNFLALSNRSQAEIASEIRRLQLARGFTPMERLNILVQALADPNAKAKACLAVFKTHAKLLRSFAEERSGQAMLIGAVEILVGDVAPKLVSYFPHILQTLYENDALSEEAITSWHELPADGDALSNKQVAVELRKNCNDLIEWFK